MLSLIGVERSQFKRFITTRARTGDESSCQEFSVRAIGNLRENAE